MNGSGAQDPPVNGELTLVFDVHINKKYGLVKPDVQQLVLQRSNSFKLNVLTEHIEENLQLEYGEGRKLLLHAICDKFGARVAGHLREINGIVPLVCDQVLMLVLTGYPHSQLKVLVEQNRPTTMTRRSSLSPCMLGFLILKRELLYLNVATYIPTKSLGSNHIMDLCRDIFEKGLKVKPELRRGVWPHLVGVFPPNMKTREERELYFNKLRRVYDSLRGKWMGKDDNDDVRYLLDAVRRDAVRTDPGNPFYEVSEFHHNSRINLRESPDEDNIQKLVNIITIYTLEHDTCTYTQGMTDILSPILYVMKREADAYICFAAMVERIRNHFETWCFGTVLKLERLKHLCEVLDPELYFHLKENVEEDAFALFFGMVLIECRREFSFDDSFHLFEAIWAAVACMKDSLPRTTTLTRTQWADYMTQVSPDVIQQVVGETVGHYSAVPLPMSESYDAYSRSRQASMLSQGSMLAYDQFRPSTGAGHPSTSRIISHTEVINEESERSNAETSSLAEVSISEATVEKRPRAFTDPSLKCSTPSLEKAEHSIKKKGLSDSHSESEIVDSYTSVPPPLKSKSSGSSRAVTEMSDMSSLSSNNALANSFKSFDSKNNGRSSAGSDRSRSPLGKVVVNGHIGVAPLDEEDDGGSASPNFEIGGDGVMLGLKLHRDEKESGEGLSNSAQVSALKAVDSLMKEPINTTTKNGILPKPPSSSGLSSNYQSALSMLPSGYRGDEGSSPSQPSGSDVYVTANDDSSVTDLQSRSISSTPSPSPAHAGSDDQPSTLSVTVKSDLTDPRLEEDHDTPIHVHQPPVPNGIIAQGMGEYHHREEHLSGVSLPFPPVIADKDDEKLTKSEESPRARPAKVHQSTLDVDSRHRAKTEPFRSSPLDIDGEALSVSSRVTPVTFFDAMQQLASSAPGTGPSFLQSGHHQRSVINGEEREAENELELSQANSMLLSQLINTDRSAPRVTREKSLELSVSDCFPLFICLSILVQHRVEIMQRNIDFVGLSVLLNTQASSQDLDATLKVARKLYKTYREYQMTFLGSRPEDLDTWLDDDRTTNYSPVDRPGDPVGEQLLNDRTSVASDDVFTP